MHGPKAATPPSLLRRLNQTNSVTKRARRAHWVALACRVRQMFTRQERSYHDRKDGALGGPLTLFASINDQLPLVLATTFQPRLQDRHMQERSIGRKGKGRGNLPASRFRDPHSF